MKKKLYPGTKEAEAEKRKQKTERRTEQPDFIGGKPNYDAFEGWTPEEVLVWLNID